jgi:DNA-binding transcriptional MerR regulator
MNDTIFNKDFLSIKEFAELVGVTVEALRHYDRKAVFQPAKYGEEYENKYRYYAPTQITTVKMIRVLTEIGVPLDTIKALAQERSPEKLIKLFSKQQGIVADELRYLQEVHSIISIFLDLLVEGVSATESEIYVSEQPEKRILLGLALRQIFACRSVFIGSSCTFATLSMIRH